MIDINSEIFISTKNGEEFKEAQLICFKHLKIKWIYDETETPRNYNSNYLVIKEGAIFHSNEYNKEYSPRARLMTFNEFRKKASPNLKHILEEIQ